MPSDNITQALQSLGETVEKYHPDPTDRVAFQNEMADFLLVFSKYANFDPSDVVITLNDLIATGVTTKSLREISNIIETGTNGKINYFDQPKTVIYRCMRNAKLNKISVEESLIAELATSRSKRDKIPYEDALFIVKNGLCRPHLAEIAEEELRKGTFKDASKKFEKK